MLDLKKATKEEMLDILLQEAQLIEDMKDLHKMAKDEDGSIFTGEPLRSIQIEDNFWNRLIEERIPEEIIITPKYTRKSDYDKRSFILKLCGNNYEIFNLYNKEA
jgi:hypothetical protein